MTLREALIEGIRDFNSWAVKKPVSYFKTTNEAEIKGIFYNKLIKHLEGATILKQGSSLTTDKISVLTIEDRRITNIKFAANRYSGGATTMLVSLLNDEVAKIPFNDIVNKHAQLYDIVEDINNFQIN